MSDQSEAGVTCREREKEIWHRIGADWAKDFFDRWPRDKVASLAEDAGETLGANIPWGMVIDDPIAGSLPEDVVAEYRLHEQTNPEEMPSDQSQRGWFIEGFLAAVLGHWQEIKGVG